MQLIRQIPLLISVFWLSACAALVSVLIPLENVAKPTGEYQVGTQVIHMVDNDRSAWYGQESSNPREIMVRVWYPAQPQEGDLKAPYVYNEKLIGDMVSEGFGIPKYLMKNLRNINGNSWSDAQPVNEKFPVIIFSHGIGGLKTQNTTQMEEMASHGYVVFSCDHAYDAGVSIFPGDRIIFGKTNIPDNLTKEEKWNMRRAQLDYRAADIQFLLDEMDRENFLSVALKNSLDLEHIGVFGHSFGGGTSVVVASVDERIDACFGLDAWFLPIPSNVLNSDLNKPFIHLGQVSWKEKENYLKLDTLAGNNSAWSVRLDVRGATHYDFTDFSQFSKLTKKYGSGMIAPPRIRKITNSAIREFFDHYLKNGPALVVETYEKLYPEVIIKRY
ncbi:MAG: dienelactone hydrolase family protein [Candidatus Marinimicrobia bacterium]|nr:dienelactone hydrolase family protein [Candidatus Neomarinimicrobiota bacterium]